MDFPYFMCFKICIFSLFLDGALAWFYLRFAQSVGAKVIVYSAFYLCLNFSFFLVFLLLLLLLLLLLFLFAYCEIPKTVNTRNTH